MEKLGHLERRNPRGAWPSESEDFTPWLAENIELLADVLGVGEIEVEGTEIPVGARFHNHQQLVTWQPPTTSYAATIKRSCVGPGTVRSMVSDFVPVGIDTASRRVSRAESRP